MMVISHYVLGGTLWGCRGIMRICRYLLTVYRRESLYRWQFTFPIKKLERKGAPKIDNKLPMEHVVGNTGY